MTLNEKTNHVEEGVSRLIPQFSDKPKIVGLLTSFLNQIQVLESSMFGIISAKDIYTAEGVNLETLGLLIGEPRSGRDDDVYRIAIFAKVRLNISEGTVEDLIALVFAVAGVSVEIQDFYPASFKAKLVDPIDPVVIDVVRLAAFINSGKPAGVRGILSYRLPGAFSFDGVPGTGYDEAPYSGSIEV